MDFPEIHDEPLDVYAKYEKDKEGNGVRMSVAFLQNGTAINPEAHDNAQALMYDFSVKCNKAVVADQIDEQEKILEKMNKDLEKVKKEGLN